MNVNTIFKKRGYSISSICLLSLLIVGMALTLLYDTDPVKAASYRDTIQAEPTLLNYWPMDETSGTTLASLAGGVSINLNGASPGQPGQTDGTAVSFNGTNNYAVTASNIDLSSHNKVVIEALVNYTNISDDNVRLGWELGPGTATETTGLYFAPKNTSDGNGQFGVALKGNTGFNLATYNQAPSDSWHQVVAVYDKTKSTNEVDLYIDGVLQSTVARGINTNNTNNFGNSLFYLMSRGGSQYFTAGKMQHLAIYSDLSAARISAHATASGITEYAPGVISSGSVTSTSASLSWTQATNGNGSISQQLQRSPQNTDEWIDVSGATSSPYTDTGLSPGTGYKYRVRYADAASEVIYSNPLNVTTPNVFPPYTANPNTVIVGPYDTAKSGTGNWSPGGAGSVQWLVNSHQYRIRQSGTISRIRLYTANTTQMTGFYLQVWRKNGTNYDLVGTSNNVVSSLSSGGFSTIDLASPISGVQMGDFYGARMETSGANASMYAYNPGSVSTRFMVNGTASSTNMNWAAQTNSATVVPIEMYMSPAPQTVFIGDSIIQGVPNNYSFLDPTDTTNLGTSIEGHFNQITGYSYQNMGHGSDTTTVMANRFTADVINLHPRIVVMEGGVNDLHNNVGKSTFMANWTSMLNAAQASSSISKIIVLKILPWTNGTNAKNQTRDDWNASLETLAAGYSKATVVDASSYVGQFRSGGDPGNLWDIQPAYSADGVHFTSAGHNQIAQALANAIDSTAPTISNVTSDKPDGSYKAGEVIDIDVTFSEPVTSTGNVTITLETGSTDRTCTFTVSNATSGTCNYIVQAGDTSSDLNVLSVTGTIKDTVENAMVNFTPSTNLSSNKEIKVDTTAPTISAITQVTTPNNDATPNFVFSSNENGSINYGGSCSSATSNAVSGNNTITFSFLPEGTYSDCTVSISDSASNGSNTLTLDSFTVDTTAPTTPGTPSTPSPTNNTSPSWNWTTSNDNGTGLADPAYEVQYSQDNTFNSGVSTDTTNNLPFELPTTLTDGVWYIRVRAVDLANNHSSYSGNGTVVVDSTSPVASNISVTSNTDTSAHITWSTNENSDSYIEYGISLSYGSSSSTSASSMSHNTTITGLTPGTVYHYRVVSTDSTGNVSNSSDQTFLTDDNDSQPPQDTDSDGIPDSTEDVGPNGGDANNDNIQDSTQANVVTLSNVITNHATVIELGQNCIIQSASTETESSQTSSDSSFNYPHALINFTADCGSAGVTTTVKLYYYDADGDFILRKYNPNTTNYSNISDASIATQTIDSHIVTTASYSVTDGEELDIDNQANGIIVDPVGLAESDDASKNPIASALANTGEALYNPVVAGLALIASGASIALYSRRRSTYAKKK